MINFNFDKNIFDKIFWIAFLFYFDPGGYQIEYFGNLLFWRINISDFLFLIMIFCFLTINSNSFFYKYSKQVNLKPLLIFLFLWSIYYIFVFGHFINQRNLGSFIVFFIKSRHIFMSYLLIYPIYLFSIRSINLFIKYLSFLALFILSLYFITILFGVPLVPLSIFSRGFISEDRYLLLGYGDFFILPNIAMVTFIFKIRPKNFNLLSIVGIFMAIHWILTITRRHIFGMGIVFVLYLLLYQYIISKSLISMKMINKIVVVSSLLFLFGFISPRIGKILVVSAESTYSIFSTSQGNSPKTEDLRLGFNHPFFLSLISKDPYWGTGFDINWFVGEQDSEGGAYAASDYPFMASLAAFGFIGIGLFSFFYFWLIKFLYNSIMYFKNMKFIDSPFTKTENILYIVFLGYFIFILLQYINYFNVMGLRRQFDQIFFYVAIIAGVLKRLEIKRMIFITSNNK